MKDLAVKLKGSKDVDPTKDLRNFNVNFVVGPYKNEEPGILINSTYGIASAKAKPVMEYREVFKQFKELENWVFLKLKVDSQRDMNALI